MCCFSFAFHFLKFIMIFFSTQNSCLFLLNWFICFSRIIYCTKIFDWVEVLFIEIIRTYKIPWVWAFWISLVDFFCFDTSLYCFESEFVKSYQKNDMLLTRIFFSSFNSILLYKKNSVWKFEYLSIFVQCAFKMRVNINNDCLKIFHCIHK